MPDEVEGRRGAPHGPAAGDGGASRAARGGRRRADDGLTPLRRQYLRLKQQHPDAILLFRLGDFYETFDEDARITAETLQIALTSRNFGKGVRAPMAGIPYHALETYLGRLLAAGHRVAICEQLTEPGRGLVERDVVRVVTPGTVAEPGLLPPRENRYLCAARAGPEGVGLAYVDVTTGEFAVTQLHPDEVGELAGEIERLDPAECLVPEGQELALGLGGRVTPCAPGWFDPAAARETLCRILGVTSLEGFGCAHLPLAVSAAGAVVAYLERTRPSLCSLLTGLHTYAVGRWLLLDAYSWRNLELVRGARTGSARGTLLWTIDHTRTPMGARLLRRWIARPLVDLEALHQRQEAVAELVEHAQRRGALATLVHGLGDLERLAGRARQGEATPRELLALRDALQRVPAIADVLREARSGRLRALATGCSPCREVVDLITRALADGGGRLIRPGYSRELDAMLTEVREDRQWIARLEQTERQRTGIRSLKVGYNKVFGYYIHVTKPNLPLVPPEYLRKQTVADGERFVTAELKEREARLAAAEERIAELERSLYRDLLRRIGEHYPALAATARSVAEVDVFLALAEVAARRGYIRPELHEGDELLVEGGRHPVVETTLPPGEFVPNDCALGGEHGRVVVLTGPNMSGKSTYLRQIALIVLLAQIGSFVPARRARVGLVDRIFTRVGAQDDIAAGASTFLVEMMETANILRHATPRSLVLLDEVGRGTSTYDGLAIARAVLEDLHDRVGARTLFATHYHELTALEREYPGVRNYNVAVTEEGGQVVFLHRIERGAADRSYGIHVAQLAGLPRHVVERARDVLAELERNNGGGADPEAASPLLPHERDPRLATISALFQGDDRSGDGIVAEVLSALLRLDVATTTPLQALNLLAELQQRLRSRCP
ncbi:MAG TPA: DNA mismatch repair protein MutS [Chloroflexota bacterium]